MTRPFVVETETLALMAHFHDALGTGHERQRHGLAGKRPGCLVISRQQGIAREGVLDVGQQQFLVLLFVFGTQADDGAFGIVQGVVLEQVRDAFVHPGAVVAHLVQRRTRQQAARWTRMHRAHALVVGIEQVVEPLVVRPVARPWCQQELLEEPGGVGKVPFGRAAIGHRLHHRVLGRQRCGQ